MSWTETVVRQLTKQKNRLDIREYTARTNELIHSFNDEN